MRLHMKEITIDDMLGELQFKLARQLDDGTWIGIYRLMYTWSVCSGVDSTNMFMYRWCFEEYEHALEFYNNMKELDDIPTNKTSLVGHRFGTKGPLAKKVYDENYNQIDWEKL